MKLTVWTYEGPPHVGAMRVATAMKGVHFVLHAPQGDTYADLLFTMIERRDVRPPVTYTTFQARDLGGDTAELFKTAAREAYDRFRPDAILVGASCTAELIQDDPGGLARALDLPVPVINLELPSYSKKENWGAAETFYRIVRGLADTSARPDPRENRRPCCNLLGPTALGFRHRDDIVEITKLLNELGIDVATVAPLGASPDDISRLGKADFNVVLYPEIGDTAARWLEKTFGQPTVRTIPIGFGATRDFIADVARVAGVDPTGVLQRQGSRLPWWSRSVDSNYLTGKRVFIFGDAAHAIAAARVARDEMGFAVVGLGTYAREFARDVRAAAEGYGIEALITDDYLEVEEQITALHPEIVLGTQMERHIAKRLGIACAVISAPVHVQDFPARYAPLMGFEGANVLFDTLVHPLVMGLEEHLLAMFRDDFEFNDLAGASHLGTTAPPAPHVQERVAAPAAAIWSDEAEKELKKFHSSCVVKRGGIPKTSLRSEVFPSSILGHSTMQSPTMRADTPFVRVVLITLDNHLSRVVAQARETLARDIPKLSLTLHAATDWENDPSALARCKEAIASADIIIATMLFMEDHIRAILPALQARREACDAMVVAMSAGEAIRLTKLGRFRMDAPQRGPLALLKRLRGKREGQASSGAGQMAMLRRLPKLLRFIPGKAQDVRAYFLTLQYWLSGSETNMANMVRFLIDRYAAGERAGLRDTLKIAHPAEYPEVGIYHPALKSRIAESFQALPVLRAAKSSVGVLLMRSYVLAGDTAHYDAVISALEAKGLRAIPVFASGLDSRPAIERFLMKDGKCSVDAVVSLTGFSLVGGPAYNDARAAQEFLANLDVPYVTAQPVEFQSLDSWSKSSAGLTPVESTIMVAIPELDGATGPMVFGGRSEVAGEPSRMRPDLERVSMLAARVARLVELRRTQRAKRRIAVVLFNFPPNAGAAGSAAYLSVFASLFNVMKGLRDDGYDVEVPESVDVLRDRILNGNAQNFGTDANVVARVAVDDHVRREPHLAEIEGQWGPAPGKQLTDGRSLLVMGERFGNILVGLQPGFGYEGDPMRLLFERGFAPTHAFSAFYRYLREDFGAHAVLHFGTHGALEFMPGKQVGLSGDCWPERLIRDLPNMYLYAANNPSEGAVAKRRSAATLVSYLTPPVAQAGLYKGLRDLKSSLDQWNASPSLDKDVRAELLTLITEQAAAVDIELDHEAWRRDEDAEAAKLAEQLYGFEQTLIPEGLHIIGEPLSPAARADMLTAMADAQGSRPARAAIDAIVAGTSPAKALALSGLKTAEGAAVLDALAVANLALSQDAEVPAVLRALDGRFIPPAPGGDIVRNPAVLPTGRNIHGFDPFRIPSAFALKLGAAQARRLIDRHAAESGALPESVAMVLWGADNLKSEGGPIAQVLALLGARPRFDSYGRLCGAALVSLEELGRPRIDVIVTLSGIFRDLLPLQIKMLAEAALLASEADEPAHLNFVRKHTLAHQAALGCDLETAALRIFSNAEGAYGANVNHMIDASCWSDGTELADAFEARKSYAYGRTGSPVRRSQLMSEVLKSVDLAYQNIESLELGVTTVDHYVDMLGGVSSAVRRAKGESINVYVGDETQGDAKVRSLAEQVSLETRTRTLNPRWYEGLLSHGHEGVRQIEAQVTNTMGWSATAGSVDPWIYEKITETYVLDNEMRERIARLNPKASMRLANRLLEAHDRKYWTPDAATLDALRKAGDELEDRLEGIGLAAAE